MPFFFFRELQIVTVLLLICDSYMSIRFVSLKQSSLIYKMSARHERRECDSSDTNAIWVRHEWDKSNTCAIQVPHECYTNDTSDTRVLHERHECDTSEKFWFWLTTRVKTCFHILIFTIWQVKDYKERNKFILRTTFWKCLISMPKCVEKVHHKN